ncbi:putative porin [Tepidimonas ignava]|uniref:Outer membrane porin protein 32 n=1 Tax=Tepidimonas ignava TaxID=114249 RepID=A0A4R3LEM3_9BURK|nr:porin [Tepidimonas ignava]TCS98362.1 putative porin [Tepidimonas ignava]TSE19524.1 Outer membrane porin protein 32 [Tepidimonas ignava]
MKKSLVALAVLAASGAAMAQSSVQVYGLVDLVLHKDKNKAAALTSGGVNGSRWGLKGSEDLGGGLKANFLLEQGFNADDGTVSGAGFGRQAYFGLSGGFGEVKLGKIWTAYDDISGATDAAFNAIVLSPVWLIFQSQYGYTYNPNNGIYYATPSFGGFSGAVSTNLREGVANTRVSAFHVKYEGGPLFVALGYQDDEQKNEKYTRIGASYDLGVAKLLGTYGRAKNADVDEWSVGADVPVASNLVVSVGYARSKQDGMKAEQGWSLAAAYALSKRTTAYAGYFDANKAAVMGRAGAPDSRFGVGLKHTF